MGMLSRVVGFVGYLCRFWCRLVRCVMQVSRLLPGLVAWCVDGFGIDVDGLCVGIVRKQGGCKVKRIGTSKCY